MNDNERVFYGQRNSGLTKLARKGQVVPGGTGTFVEFYSTALNNRGDVAIVGWATGMNGSLSGEGLYRSDNGTDLIPVLGNGQPVPNGNGYLDYFALPILNDAGDLVFHASLGTTDGFTDGMSIHSDDGLMELGRGGTPIPDGSGYLQQLYPRINNLGDVVFSSGILDDPGGAYLGQGLFKFDDS